MHLIMPLVQLCCSIHPQRVPSYYQLHSIEKKLNAAEQKYPVHDHKILAIIQACSKWRCYLINKEVVVYTDHKPLQYL